MKLTSVELHPANSSDVAVLSFRDPSRSNRYNVKGILGLDADEIVPKFYSGSGGSAKYNLTLEKRDITTRIGLSPDFSLGESYASLRDDLYRVIASARTGIVQIQFKNGTSVVAAVSGFVKKFETALFEKSQEVQLTISCLDPMLRAPTPVVVDTIGLDPAATTITDDLSTAPHGFKFDLTFLNGVASLTIEDPADESWSFQITPSGGFLINDVLHFSSEYNDKYIYLTRAGNDIHLADVLALGSVWPILFPGDNDFSLSSPTNVAWTNISYIPTYWGV